MKPFIAIVLLAASAFASAQQKRNVDVAGLWVSLSTNGVDYKAWLRIKPDGTWQTRVTAPHKKDVTGSGTFTITLEDDPSFVKGQLVKCVDLQTEIYNGKRLSAKEKLESEKRYVVHPGPDGDVLTDLLTVGFARVEQESKIRAKLNQPGAGKNSASAGSARHGKWSRHRA